MTTGSWDHRASNGDWLNQKTWSGPDRLTVTYPKPQYRKVFLHGMWIKFRTTPRPPKRVRDQPHPYDATAFKWDNPRVVYQNNNGDVGTYRVMETGGSPSGLCAVLNAVDLLGANDQLKLINKVAEQIKGSDFNLATFLGEGNQSLEMIADGAIRIRKGLHFIRRGDVSGAIRSLTEGTSRSPLKRHVSGRKVSGDLSSNWLELQYGWLPLLQDVEAASLMLAHAAQAPFQTTYRASVRRESLLSFNGGGATPLDRRYTYRWLRTHQRSMIVTIKEKMSSVATLGLDDPLSLAWELLPYSFVADWFIPIGQYLEARHNASSIQGTWVQSDLKRSRWAGVSGALNGNGAKFEHAVMKRIVSQSSLVDVPQPTFKGLAKAASWQHAANSVALLTQQFVGKRG
jgi:hypothetical protein